MEMVRAQDVWWSVTKAQRRVTQEMADLMPRRKQEPTMKDLMCYASERMCLMWSEKRNGLKM